MTAPPPRHALPSRTPARAAIGKARPKRRRSAGSKIVGGIGELLITLGVLGLLFIVWELWWTGIEAESDRQDSLDQFYAEMPEPPDAAEADQASAEGPNPADFETCYTLPDGSEIGCAPTMNQLADEQQIMGTLYAPRLGDDWAAPVREGVTAAQIDRGGVGRYPDTQMPDEPGNFSLAGHRNTHASMLGNQDDLQIGDQLYLVSPDGMYTYEVAERRVVAPHQTEVLAPAPGEPGASAEIGTLTLTTCHPMFSNAERLIHHAEITDFTPLGGEVSDELDHHEPIRDMFYTGGA